MNKIKNILIVIVMFLGMFFSINAYAEEITYAINDDGNWDISIGDIKYRFVWYGEEMKVTGTDGTCYWVYGDSEIKDCI